MRTTKNFKVVKSKFYINNPNDYGYYTEDIAEFNNQTDAEWFCEDNIERLCKDKECLEIQRCFNEDDKVYVIATYNL